MNGAPSGLRTALQQGARYVAAVFLLGFVLGVPRTLWLAPALGATPAVLIELPLLLGFSWWWCRRLLRQQPLDARERALMGGSALCLLLLAELALSLALAGRSLAGHLALYRETAHQIGLAGQLVFAVLPLGVRRRPREG